MKRNKFISLCLLVLLLATLPLTVMAKDFDYDRKGSISVTLAASNPAQPMAGAELSVYYIATMGINTDGKMNYIFTAEYQDCGFALDDPALVEKMDSFVTEHAVSSRKIVTDAQGKATCDNLELGLYFVKQTGDAAGFAPCTPFLVTVPMETADGYQYDVNASPKTDVIRLVDITIKKVWNTGKSSGIPTSVTVQLLRGEEVVATATLNKQNNWQVTYKDMPESDSYSINEVNVPKNYKATYTHTGYVFTVTNTSNLAQTGQLVWPIPVFALAGIFLLMAGFMILRKSEHRNG